MNTFQHHVLDGLAFIDWYRWLFNDVAVVNNEVLWGLNSGGDTPGYVKVGVEVVIEFHKPRLSSPENQKGTIGCATFERPVMLT